MQHADASIAEAHYCRDELGLQGIGVGTTALGVSLDDPSYNDLWTSLSEREAVVFVHPVNSPDTITVGMDRFMMGPSFSGPQEAGIAAFRFVQDDVPARFPGIRWVIATMGGTFPLLWRRFQDISESVGRSGSLGNDVQRRIRGIYYDTTLTDDPSVLRLAVDELGSDRIVLGSDAPRVDVGNWIERTRLGLSLSQEEWNNVRGGTIAPLLANAGSAS